MKERLKITLKQCGDRHFQIRRYKDFRNLLSTAPLKLTKGQLFFESKCIDSFVTLTFDPHDVSILNQVPSIKQQISKLSCAECKVPVFSKPVQTVLPLLWKKNTKSHETKVW